jgi:hypothetical protein
MASSANLVNPPLGAELTPQPTQPIILYDLTSQGLSEAQKSLLTKGLSFIPSNNLFERLDSEWFEDRAAVQTLHTRFLRRLWFDSDESSQGDKRDLLKQKSDWVPPTCPRPCAVYWEKFEEGLHTLLEQTPHRARPNVGTNKANLTPIELRALYSLKCNKDVTIKPADKGGAVVAMDTRAYIAAIEQMLSDRKHYADPSVLDLETRDETDFVVTRMHGCRMISQDTMLYCIHHLHRDRPFFGLPKVHKDRSKWAFGIPPLRPIISDCPSATYIAGKLLDTFLQPISTTHDSYIRDTPHLMQVLRSVVVLPGTTLFTCDVESLYTNIPHDAGIEAVRLALREHWGEEKSTEIRLVCRLLRIQLMNNNFVFNERHYTQIHGCAMGKSWAPAYANIFMAHWEQRLRSATAHLPQPSIWKRFIDDILGVFPGTRVELQSFLDIANSLDPNIHLTTEIGEQGEVNFLDLTIMIRDDRLVHQIYTKPTHTAQYIRWQSEHPRATKRAVAVSQFLRILRNCTLEEHAQAHCLRLRKELIQRGFGPRVLGLAYKQARSIQDKKQTENTQRTNGPSPTLGTPLERRDILSIRFRPHLARLQSQLHLLHDDAMTQARDHMLDRQGDLQRITRPPMVAWKRSKNLRDFLVRART